MFETNPVDLRDILRAVDEGKMQLPDFQRDYVWNEEDVRSLIASIAKGFPVGAILTLRTGGAVNFKPRLLEGVPARDREPEELLLDGQQRITTLYQSAFASRYVVTRNTQGKVIHRYYYINIDAALAADADLQDAIVGVPEDRQVRNHFQRKLELDLSSEELEFQSGMFPLNRAFEAQDWFYRWRDYNKMQGDDIGDRILEFQRRVLDPLTRYKMPVIRLEKENSREAICLVFEKVNVGGKKLDAFELLTAIYAASEFNLREEWSGTGSSTQPGRRERIVGIEARRDVLSKVANTDYLQACTLLHTRDVRLAKEQEGVSGKELPQISCKREALLALPLEAYQQYSDTVERGFVEAAAFMNEQKIIWHKDVPYPPLLVGLACIFAILGKEAQTVIAKEKIAQWFWCITLGELYGASTETRLARDVPEVVEWIRGGNAPRALEEAIFQQERLRSLRIRIAAAYKGIHALLMRQGCQDFITGKPTDIMTFFNDQIDIHHIFPMAWCKKQGIPPNVYDSIVNKTALSKASNITIGGSAPSVYLKRIEEKHGISPDRLDEILRTHLIEPEFLRNDDFEGFFNARMRALSGLVAEAMGKRVMEETGTNEPEHEPSANLYDEAEEEEAA